MSVSSGLPPPEVVDSLPRRSDSGPIWWFRTAEGPGEVIQELRLGGRQPAYGGPWHPLYTWAPPASSPPPPLPTPLPGGQRFCLLDQHQVLDQRTGLIWTRGNVPGFQMTWDAACVASSALELGGVRTWRLPTREELASLIDDTRHTPAIDPILYCESDPYWTATPAAYKPGDYAWVVRFSLGHSTWAHRRSPCCARAVRSFPP